MIANFISFLFKIPFGIRVAIGLLVLLFLWKYLGKVILWILSAIPFLVEKIFILIYQIIELPVAILHKKLGADFYKVDNFMAEKGEKIDEFLKKWYDVWHQKYEFRWGKAILIYFICLVIIVLPSLVGIKNEWLKKGEELYLFSEDMLIEWFEKRLGYDFEQDISVVKEEVMGEKEEKQNSEIELVVSGVNSSLLVRDVPDMKNGVALERLYNGDIVVWNGELLFEEAENNHVEAWVKVITQNNVEGWSRLFYLYPKNYEKSSFYVEEEQIIKLGF